MGNEPTPEFPLYIEQGVDFLHEFLWLGAGKFIAPIEKIQRGYPTVITVTGHEINDIPTPQPVIISGVNLSPNDRFTKEESQLNSKYTQIESVLRLTDDTFSIPVSTVNERWKRGTGEITYHKPTPLAGYTGVMQIRKNWYSETVIHELTTENGGISLTDGNGGIALYISKADTALLDFVGGVYDIDLVKDGIATRVFRGPITMMREISQ